VPVIGIDVMMVDEVGVTSRGVDEVCGVCLTVFGVSVTVNGVDGINRTVGWVWTRNDRVGVMVGEVSLMVGG
jgi:hypothetical protein